MTVSVVRRVGFVAALAVAGWLLASTMGGEADAGTLSLGTFDADGDGWIDTIEDALGSNKANPLSTPEHIAVPPTCFDLDDNDLDSKTDGADPGCHAAPVHGPSFPSAGTDIFDSTIELNGYLLPTPAGPCPVDFLGSGPVVVVRESPFEGEPGHQQFQTEIVSMELTGEGTLLPGSPCNPGPVGAPFHGTLIEHPGQRSLGTTFDQNPEADSDFPADSFFDVFFLVDTPFGLLQGGPEGGSPGQPTQVIANDLTHLPPYGDCFEVTSGRLSHCPKAPLDHFKCYSTVRFPAFDARTVTITDQFFRGKVRVRDRGAFCNSVAKNGEPIFDPGAHLTFYDATSGKATRASRGLTVVVQNQFGRQRFEVQDFEGIALPTKKNAHAPPLVLDHFACYSVKGRSVDAPVVLVDQFGRERSTALDPVVLCNPARKKDTLGTTDIGDEAWHLTCYDLVKSRKIRESITIENQFEKVGGVARNDPDSMLCVPSAKLKVRSAKCNGQVATILGTNGSEIIRGTRGDDIIQAKGGADVVFGLGGNDTVCGGGGRDDLRGGAGGVVLRAPLARWNVVFPACRRGIDNKLFFLDASCAGQRFEHVAEIVSSNSFLSVERRVDLRRASSDAVKAAVFDFESQGLPQRRDFHVVPTLVESLGF